MAYVEEIQPPYLNDRLTAERIRLDFEQDPMLAANRQRFIVIGGASLVLRGIIDSTPDIDVLAPHDDLQRMQQLPGAETVQPPFYARQNGADNFNVRFQTHPLGSWVCATDRLGDGHYPMSFNRLDIVSTTTVNVSGIRCLSLDVLEASKKALRREKDLRHLDAIKKFRAQIWSDWEEPF